MRVKEALKTDSGCYLSSSYRKEDLEICPGTRGCVAPVFHWMINKNYGQHSDTKGLNKIFITPFEALRFVLPLYLEGVSPEKIYNTHIPYFEFKDRVTLNMVRTFCKAFDCGKLTYWINTQNMEFGLYAELTELANKFKEDYGDKYGFKK